MEFLKNQKIFIGLVHFFDFLKLYQVEFWSVEKIVKLNSSTMGKTWFSQLLFKLQRGFLEFFLTIPTLVTLENIISFPEWLRDRLISVELEPVIIHTETSYIASYYRRIYKITKLVIIFIFFILYPWKAVYIKMRQLI